MSATILASRREIRELPGAGSGRALGKVLQLMRSDLRRLWPLTLAWIALVTSQLAFHLVVPVGSGERQTSWFSANEAILPMLLYWVLIPVLVLPFRPLGGKAFWLTRPMGYPTVLAEKLLFVALFWQLPLLLLEAVGLRFYGAHAHELVGLVAAASIRELFLLALFVLLAAWTGKTWGVPLASVALTVGGMVLPFLLEGALGPLSFRWLWLDLVVGRAYPVATAAVGGVLLAAVWTLYGTRRPRSALWVLAGALAIGFLFPRGVEGVLRAPRSLAPPRVQGGPAEISTGLFHWPGGEAGAFARIAFDLRVDTAPGAPPGHVATRLAADLRSFELAGGPPLEASGGVYHLWAGRGEALAAAAGVEVLAEGKEADLRMETGWEIDPGKLSSLEAPGGSLSLDLLVASIRSTERASVALRPGSGAADGSLRIQLQDVRLVGREVWVDYGLRRIVATPPDLGFELDFSEIELLLVEREAKWGLLPAVRPGSLSSAGSVSWRAPWPASRRKTEDERVLTARPVVEVRRDFVAFELPEGAVAEDWLEKGELLVLQNRLLGWKRVPVKIEDLRLEKEPSP